MNARAVRARDLAVASSLTGWLVVTGLSQHPNRAFDRFRGMDRTGTVIPNWRFFAPEPAMHDFRVLHRHMGEDGDVSAWRETTALQRRRLGQTVWFPDRRRDKAISDICNEIISQLDVVDDRVVELPCYRLLRDLVAGVVADEGRTGTVGGEVAGFQFLVARSGGYDPDIEPEYLFASPYETWRAHADA
ncbi:hypothetical protein [Jatrophihabitans fulvus]